MSTNTPQLSYTKFPTSGGAGRIYDHTEFLDIATGIDPSDATGVPFGCLVSAIAGGQSALTGAPTVVRLPNAAGDVAFPNAFGVSLQTVLIENLDVFNVASNVYPANRPIACIRKGRVWVPTEVNVAVGDDVYVRYSANGPLTQLGAFRNDADGGHAAKLATAKWFLATTGGFAVVEVNC